MKLAHDVVGLKTNRYVIYVWDPEREFWQVWHERATGRSGALDLDQPELKWNSKGRFKITLKENEVRDLGTIEIPADAISG